MTWRLKFSHTTNHGLNANNTPSPGLFFHYPPRKRDLQRTARNKVCAAFLDLMEQMITWLKNQDGFVAYELYEGQIAGWTELHGKNVKQAQDGLSEFLSTEIAQQILPLVERDYSSFFGEAIASA